MGIEVSTDDIKSVICHKKTRGIFFTFSKGTELNIEDTEKIKYHVAKIETIAKKRGSRVIFFPNVINPVFAGCLAYMGYEQKKKVTVNGKDMSTDDENSYSKLI
jgi:hypothetical protein